MGSLIELEGLGIDIEEVIMGGTLPIQTLVK